MAEIKSLKIGAPKRKQFMIDGDESKVIELDTGDTGILARWNSMQKWFEDVQKRMDEFQKISSEDDVDLEKVSTEFAVLSDEVRDHMNELFDSDVCTPIVGNGSMLRTVNGEPLFLVTLEALVPLYEADIKTEMQKTSKRIAKHTSKYRG